MENFFAYRDPLFGLVIFFALIFIVSFFSYWWALYRAQEKKRSLSQFFHKFESSIDKEINALLEDKKSKEALMLLARAFERSGDYEKAIGIYLKLQEEFDEKERLTILRALGELYFKAGFLARSQEIYEEILGLWPRDIQTLKSLLLLYEKIGQFKEALKIAEVLEELEPIAQVYKDYLILKSSSFDKKLYKTIYERSPILKRAIFEDFFRYDFKGAWEILKEEDFKELFDILWYLPKSKIALHNPFLEELYSAKGYIQRKKSSSHFALDLLLHYPKADLEFMYLCKGCKQTFPFSFMRCPSCQEIAGVALEWQIVPKRRESEEGLSI